MYSYYECNFTLNYGGSYRLDFDKPISTKGKNISLSNDIILHISLKSADS